MGNTFKTAFLLTAMTLLLMAIGRAFGGQNGMFLALQYDDPRPRPLPVQLPGQRQAGHSPAQDRDGIATTSQLLAV